MPDKEDLLVEVGTEELPPQSVQPLSEALGAGIVAGLASAGLTHGDMSLFATPRRLAVLITALQTTQDERQVERRGPALAAAFDTEDQPTKAALGFARSCGVALEHLDKLETDKGSWLVFRTTEVGQTATSLLPDIVERALSTLPVKRRMRWADLEEEFVRPVHWLVLMLGEEIVDADLLGVSTGRHTQGHRFHQPTPLPIDSPAAYAPLLYASAHVVADFDTRREMIRKQVEAAALEAGGVADIDPGLLEEVTALVEWPVAVLGSFDEEFLSLPSAVLIATMKGAQRYFHVTDTQGRLLPRFITISNIESRNPDAVRHGNERVIRPRLKDAAFFYTTDLKHSLESRLEGVAQLKFQAKLGSMLDKSQRVSALSAHIAQALGSSDADVETARRAGLLSKCDLVTEMVGEFPELQGDMGCEYARLDGESEALALALGEQYMPRFAGDTIPATPIGRAVSMADKLDTLIGIFAIGQQPSGDKDPFALRRAALGVLRILIEAELDLALPSLIEAAAKTYGTSLTTGEVRARVFDFMMDRLRAYFLEQHVPVDVFGAVMARRPTRPYDFARRVQAVDAFRRIPEAASLASANKRIQNILKQNEDLLPESVDDTLLAEDAEWNLAAKLVGVGPRVREMLKAGEYGQAMAHLAGLRDAVDAFFDTVKVMDDDDAVRRNRLALLNNLSVLFLATADISRLSGP